ncbi:MAG: septum formation initiator family protein [Bacteroidetes bacterium]|nr:septum formation initiator family protein [Bacteroidota bacterium]MCW5894608.1 septum formation initiator family protein [Bacteroidota bacterium]
MKRKHTGDLEDLLHRTESDASNIPARAPRRQTQRPTPEPAARRIYNGDPQSKIPGYAVRPENKKVERRKRRSTFNIVTALFLAAIAIVVYIGNIITVNQLVVEVHQLQTRYDKISNSNNVLKAEINRKSGWESIGNTAKTRLGLTHPEKRAQAFDVDERKLNKFSNK